MLRLVLLCVAAACVSGANLRTSTKELDSFRSSLEDILNEDASPPALKAAKATAAKAATQEAAPVAATDAPASTGGATGAATGAATGGEGAKDTKGAILARHEDAVKKIEEQHAATTTTIKENHKQTVSKIQATHAKSVTACKTVSDAVEDIAGNHDKAVKKIVKDCVKEKTGKGPKAPAASGGAGPIEDAPPAASGAAGPTKDAAEAKPVKVVAPGRVSVGNPFKLKAAEDAASAL